MSKVSEAEDDPESYESSEDEWDEPEEKKSAKRRSVRQPAKKAKLSSDVEDESSDSESEDESIEENLPRSKNGAVKKNTKSPKVTPSSSAKKAGKKNVNSKNFSIGSFVIAKQDAKVGDPNKHPWIWRVDGKSLLQKYEPFEEDGKIRHKSTSIYTGWSPMDMDDYAPLTVDIIDQTEGDVVLELHWDELKKIVQNDSD